MPAVDVDVHTNPAVGSAILYWIAEAHQEVRSAGQGILLPWGILALGLMSTDQVRETLPENRSTIGGWLRRPENEAWRGAVPEIMRAWTLPFWKSTAVGIAGDFLRIAGGRLITGKGIAKPTGAGVIQIRRRARALGGTLGSEASDAVIASVLGVEFQA